MHSSEGKLTGVRLTAAGSLPEIVRINVWSTTNPPTALDISQQIRLFMPKNQENIITSF